MQAQDPVPRHFVAGVVQQPCGADEVLDMGRFEKPEASVLPVRDLPRRQLYLDQVAVMARPHEHGLLAQVHPALVGLQNPVDDRPRFRGCVVAAIEGGPCPRAAVAVQSELGLSVGERSEHVGHIEDALPGSEVALELHRGRARIRTDEVTEVAWVRPAEPVDRLRFVADHGEALSLRSQQPDDVDLEAVHVLVFVDQHETETCGEMWSQIFVPQERAPVEQEIVEVQEGRAPFAGGEVPEQRSDDVRMRCAPRVFRWHDIAQWALGIDAAGIDVDEGRGSGKPCSGPGQVVVVAQQIHQIAGPGRVKQAEALGQAEHLRVGGDVAVGDRVEGPSLGTLVPSGPDQITSPGEHVVRSSAGEREQQDPIRWHPTVEEAGQPGRQGSGLARARTGDDEEWGISVRRNRELGFVQSFIPGGLVSEHMFVE